MGASLDHEVEMGPEEQIDFEFLEVEEGLKGPVTGRGVCVHVHLQMEAATISGPHPIRSVMVVA
jgi:hypothetical protein